MIDNYLLEELVVFSKTQTLAKTAEKLMVTQPTVTRGMQKLEEELGVTLFDRQPNKITLTKTGQLAAQQAKKLLAANQDFVTQIRNFDQTQQTIKIGTIAPGPLPIAEHLKQDFNVAVDRHFVLRQDVNSALLDHQYSLIFSDQEIQNDQIESLFIGKEHLMVNLDQFMYLANKQRVTFKELRGLSFVVLSDIGPWKQIIQDNIPDAKFLYQAQRDAMTEITKYSNFPYFSTNVTDWETDQPKRPDNDRVRIPITDAAATMTFYVSYLKSRRAQLRPVLQELSTLWPAESTR
jgi:DNA-binding transcriptional LysR family regulator